MKVGITGASGFLGSAIMAEGKRRDWTIVAFSRGDHAVEGAEETRSLADPARIDLAELDALVHLAGEPIVGLWTKDKKKRIHQSRVELTSALVEAMTRDSATSRPAVFVSASAIGYYGDRADGSRGLPQAGSPDL